MNSPGTTESATSSDIGLDSRPVPRPSGLLARIAATSWFAASTLIVAALLLVSMGGAIIAAPVTLPLLIAIARTRTGPGRVLATILAALTFGEVVWAISYVAVGETQPWIWLLPTLGGLALGWWTWQRGVRA